MNKIINKFLNNYYESQLIYKIINLMFFYDLDYKFVINKKGFKLQVKKPEYKDELYTTVGSFNENEYLSNLIDWKSIAEQIDNAIVKYEKIKY